MKRIIAKINLSYCILVVCCLCLCTLSAHAQQKGTIYGEWGYNRSIFSKSDIHMKGNDFDVTFYNVIATDRPYPFTLKNYFSLTKISIPQFNVRMGYFLKHNFALSLGYDHMKYVVKSYQDVLLSGIIKPQLSATKAGAYFNQLVNLTPDFFAFEHTNGLNSLTLDAEYHTPKLNIAKKWNFNAYLGSGLGIIIPKSDIRFLDYGIDNPYHIAGYTLGTKVGATVTFANKIFLRPEVKGGYITLPNVLINGNTNEKANHEFTYVEWMLKGGFYLNTKNKNKIQNTL